LVRFAEREQSLFAVIEPAVVPAGERRDERIDGREDLVVRPDLGRRPAGSFLPAAVA
jgi:hypothetical protein